MGVDSFSEGRGTLTQAVKSSFIHSHVLLTPYSVDCEAHAFSLKTDCVSSHGYPVIAATCCCSLCTQTLS